MKYWVPINTCEYNLTSAPNWHKNEQTDEKWRRAALFHNCLCLKITEGEKVELPVAASYFFPWAGKLKRTKYCSCFRVVLVVKRTQVCTQSCPGPFISDRLLSLFWNNQAQRDTTLYLSLNSRLIWKMATSIRKPGSLPFLCCDSPQKARRRFHNVFLDLKGNHTDFE